MVKEGIYQNTVTSMTLPTSSMTNDLPVSSSMTTPMPPIVCTPVPHGVGTPVISYCVIPEFISV